VPETLRKWYKNRGRTPDLFGWRRRKTARALTNVCNKIDMWYEFLTTKGSEYPKEPRHSDEFGVHHSLFVSSYGFRIETQEFGDTDWFKRRP